MTLRTEPHARLLSLWTKNRTMFRCWLCFVALLAIFHVFLLVGWGYWDVAVVWTAQLLAWSLSLLGHTAQSDGTRVLSTLYSVNVIRDCTAVHPIGIFVAAVVAYPARWRAKLIGVAAGVCALIVVNQVRLVSLCYIGRWYAKGFEVSHLIVWQALIVLFSVVLFLAWAMVADRR